VSDLAYFFPSWGNHLGANDVYERFEMLAFKSDVSHWRSQKELVGVSVRYVTGIEQS
jgi:hypothetical protein